MAAIFQSHGSHISVTWQSYYSHMAVILQSQARQSYCSQRQIWYTSADRARSLPAVRRTEKEITKQFVSLVLNSYCWCALQRRYYCTCITEKAVVHTLQRRSCACITETLLCMHCRDALVHALQRRCCTCIIETLLCMHYRDTVVHYRNMPMYMHCRDADLHYRDAVLHYRDAVVHCERNATLTCRQSAIMLYELMYNIRTASRSCQFALFSANFIVRGFIRCFI